MSGTNYNWSVQYDYNVGTLGGQGVTGYTTTIRDYQSPNNVYVGYTIYEVTKEDYDSGGIDRSLDTFFQHAANVISYYLSFPAYIITEASPNQLYMNLFTNCAQYNSEAAALPFFKGSSTYYD